MKIAKWVILFLISALIVLVQAFPSFSQSQSVLINEFMPHPSSGPDWIELFNVSSVDIDISGWSIFDSTGKVTTFDAGTIVEGDDPAGNNFYQFSVSNRLNNSGDEVKLFSSSGVGEPVDIKSYTEDLGLDNSFVRYPDGGETWFVSMQPTPGAKNIYQAPENPAVEDESQTQPTISFSVPSSITVGTPFSVSVTLKNFKSGTYALKVLIGKDGKFIYGNTKGASGWLTQNGKWAEMPRITISSSGNKTIQAKTDGDVAAGKYLIKVRAHKDSDNFDSGAKSVTVSGTAESESIPGAEGTSEAVGDGGMEPSFAEATEGEVLGEASSKGGFKLSFYTILGIFGMLVGSGGLILAFRRGAQRSQTPNTPEPERGPL